MRESPDVSGPSDLALAAAEGCNDFMADLESGAMYVNAREAVERAHDPALGLDASVCLRSVYDWMCGQHLLTRAEELRKAFSDGPGADESAITLADVIRTAHQAVEEAEAERGRLIALALDQGATTRQIAPLLSVAPSTVWRWAGGKRNGDKGFVLDAPASAFVKCGLALYRVDSPRR